MRDVRVFVLGLIVVISLFMLAVVVLRTRSVEALLIEDTKHGAKSYADLIIIVRRWNATHSGAYVEKTPGMESNPYLKSLGIEPDVPTADGRVLTLKTPATMTREMSSLSRDGSGGVWFRIVSQKPLNPQNGPDEVERRALEQFSRGSSEFTLLDRAQPQPSFRYIVPLITEEGCLKCHAQQGYKVGDIRGAVSITIKADTLLDHLRRNRIEALIFSLVVFGPLLGIIVLMTWRLAVCLDRARVRLRHAAVTDEMTGMSNRRDIMKRLDQSWDHSMRSAEPLSLVIVDIDHFKRINDTYGHAVGDKVLGLVAGAIRSTLRSYDLLGRIGGEEFLIVCVGTAMDDGGALAERIRAAVKAVRLHEGNSEISVSVSAGVTSLRPKDSGTAALLRRCDDALLLAKRRGRDRVVAV